VWNLSKYDSIEALKMPMIKRTLSRYVKIITEGLPARFLISKRIVFNFDKSMTTKQLWRAHEEMMKSFYQTQIAIDRGKLDFEELGIPRFSLLDLKIKLVESMLKSCDLCEHACSVDRTQGQKGKCRVGETEDCIISSENIHMGEEAHIIPSHTIFFMGCNLHCQFCQNWSISQWKEQGYVVAPERLAEIIETRRQDGARNVNWVGGEPTPQLLCVLKTLKGSETNTPQIWNSNFYMSERTMQMLDGVVDMYLSDFKYGNSDCARHISKIPDYFQIAARNHRLAAKQAEITIRHLVLPDHVDCCTKPVFKWIAKNIRAQAIVNIMDQYYPAYNAYEFTNLKRRVDELEMKEAINYAKKLKLKFVT